MINEHAQGTFTQIVNKVLLVFEYLSDNIGEEHVLPVLSVIGTFVFIVGVGYLMAYLVRIEEENVQKKQNSGNNNNNGKVKNKTHRKYIQFNIRRYETGRLCSGVKTA